MSENLAELKAEKVKEIAAEFSRALAKVQTEQPRPEDVKAFQTVLQQHPQMWRVMGDLAKRAKDNLIADMSIGQATRASLDVGMQQLAAEWRRPNDGPLEELLIEQVQLCWLRLHYVELEHQGAHSSKTISHSSSDFWDRKLTAAQQRYLRAIESLARVRRLSRMPIRVRIEAPAQQLLKVVDAS